MTTRTQINLSWPGVPGATGYTVSRNGTVVTSTKTGTYVHGLVVANGDTIAVAAAVPAPPPTPPTTGTGAGTIRYGSGNYSAAQVPDLSKLDVLLASGSNYPSVPADLKAAGAKTRALRYQSAISCSVDYESIPLSTAAANGWLLKAANGQPLVNVGYTDKNILDISNPAVSTALANDVVAKCRAGGWSGAWFDDVVAYGAALCGLPGAPQLPSGWTQQSWHDALVQHVLRVGAIVKAAGLEMVCNASGWLPDDPASNDGTNEKAFWSLLAPGVTGLTCEYWEQRAEPPLDVMTVNSVNWMGHWDGWRTLHSFCQQHGIAFLPIFYGTNDSPTATYIRSTFLLDYDGGKSALILFDTAYGLPTSGAWSKNMGPAVGAAVTFGNGYSRQFANGTVAIDPVAGTASIS